MTPRATRAKQNRVAWAKDVLRLTTTIVELLEQETSTAGIADRSALILKEFTGLEKVSIVLVPTQDRSALGQSGLSCKLDKPNQFVCQNLFDNGIDLNSDGAPARGCLGRQIVRGRVSLPKKFFSPGGSFRTNNIDELLESSAAKDLQCTLSPSIAEHVQCPLSPPFGTDGTISLAVVLLRSGQGIVGLMMLGDSRGDMLSPQLMELMEAVGNVLGIVISRMAALEVELGARQALEMQVEQLKKSEHKILLSQQQLGLAMRAGDLGLWDWNIITGEMLYDQGRTAILGYPPEESRSDYRAWTELIHPEDKSRVVKTLERYIHGITAGYECEYRLRSKSGDWKWILDRGKIVERDVRGRPSRMVGIYFDVTLRKRVEAALRQNEERFRKMFETAEDCIYFKDGLLMYTEVNPAMASTLGIPASSIAGHTDEDLFGPAEAEIIAESDRLALSGQTVEQEHTRTVKGTKATFLDLKAPIRDSQGEVVGILGISRDMTHRRHVEEFPESPVLDSRSPRMRAALVAARAAARTDSIVLLTGESGVGKDYVAKYLHQQSKRAHGPFFSINCAAISPELAESELFGYESGAFTGASGSKKGLLELAEGGSILLNEIGELSPALQSKLLTFLDTRQFTRVGGVKMRSVNARLIAATNQNLEQEVKLNRFRKDLFYRLAVISIEVPPLRERIEDMALLVPQLLGSLAQQLGMDRVPDVSPDALKALESYSWPGNVRELRKVLERALILCDKKTISLKDMAVGGKSGPKGTDREWSVRVHFPERRPLNDVVSDLKRRLVVEALRRAGGRRKRAAALLGLSPDALKHYMKVFDLYG